MALRRISFAAIFASLVLVLAWTVFKWTRTSAATEPGPVVALLARLPQPNMVWTTTDKC
jgi:hypothetical protein